MTTLKSNMLKKGKKGFTLTELAIVIAVIAILIAVLVPTFTSVITSAKKTTAAENAHNALTEFTIETYANLPDGSVVEVGDYYVKVADGTVSADTCYATTDSTSGIDVSSGYIEYVWAEEVDSALSDVTIYIETTDMTQSIAEVIAENIADTYDSTKTITFISVSTYNYSVTTDASSVRTVKYDTTATAPSSTPDTSTYTGISVYVGS